MAKMLRHNSLVVSDLQQAIDWYESRSLSAVNRFRAVTRAAFTHLARSPELSAIVFEDLDVRLFRIPRFPYMILYRIHGDIVVIEGIFHTSTDPDTWRRRAGGRSD